MLLTDTCNISNDKLKTNTIKMKTEIVIWQGEAKVVLYAENEFEMDLIEKIKDSRIGYETKTTVLTDYNYHSHTKHRIEINLIENKK